ncbi:MAG: MATE family efflux transporter [Aquisalinus sp.]|nr:MATE family efflux transporter [Aquisalinus sp.]
MPVPLPNILRKLLQQKSLMETVGNASVLVLTRFGGAVANFIFTLLLAQYLAPSQVGFVMTALSLGALASLFTTLNMENGAVRHLLQPLEKGNTAEAAGFMAYGWRVLRIATPIVIVGLIAFMLLSQSLKNELTRQEFWAVFFLAISVPMLAMLRLGTRWAHALSKIKRSMLSWALFRPLILCLAVGGAALFFGGLRVDIVLLANAVACLVALIIQHFLLRSAFAFTKDAEPDTSRSRDWMSTGLYLSVTILLIDYFQNVVIVTSALGLSDGDVARLAVALRFIGFLRMGLMAVNMAVSPRVSKAISAERMGDAQHLLSQSTHLKFWPTVIVTALVWWLAPFLVGLFGEDYEAAAWPLRLFALLPLVAAFFGPSIMVLNVTGRQQDIFRLSAVSLGLLVVSVPVAGISLGLNGAAAAAVLSVFVWEWALFDRTKRDTGIDASIMAAMKLLLPKKLSAEPQA